MRLSRIRGFRPHLTSQASPVWSRPQCLSARLGEAGDSFCCWDLIRSPVCDLVIYFRCGRLRLTLHFTIFSFLVDQGLSSIIRWQHNWIQRVIQITAIGGMALTGAPAVHIAAMLLCGRRSVLDARKVGTKSENSTQVMQAAIPGCPLVIACHRNPARG